MREPRQQTLETDEELTLVSGEEATLVSPRFDDEETLVARPVVPLDAATTEAPAAAHASAPPPAAYTQRPRAPRRPWVLALVLVSVLIGGVLGGAGLYLYQRQTDEAASTAPSAETPPADAQAETQPQPAPTAEAPAATQTEPAAESAETDAADTPEEDAASAPAEPEPKTVPAAAVRRDDGASTDTRQRSQKGENHVEVERPARRGADAPVAREDEPEARRTDTIIYRQRRAERRAERQAERRAARRARRNGDDVDRLRRIFEGEPQ